MAQPLLSVEDFSVFFRMGAQEEVRAVQQISFDIATGETVALVGESGSGKSVTAHAILRLLPYPKAYHPTGHIFFEGRNLLTETPEALQEVRGGRIGIIFQEPMVSLNPLHTIKRQIEETLILHENLNESSRKKRVLELLDLVGFEEGKRRLTAYPHQLSGGQRQRVMIAMALACSPCLLIADEPTTALDVTLQAEILTRLKEIQKQTRMALLLITHNLGLVEKMADRVLVMSQGKIVESGLKETILKAPQHPYTKKLLASEPTGAPAPIGLNAPLLLEGRNISVSFDAPSSLRFFFKPRKQKTVVNNISFKVYQGETLGIVGESGSGKTTLALAILRLLEAKGTLFFKGKNIAEFKKKRSKDLCQYLQIVFQDPFGSLNPRLSVEQIIAEGLKVHHLVPNLTEQDKRVAQVLRDVGLNPDDRYRYPHEFSGGQRQRIAIARALILNPALIILDEPTSALDLSIQAEILALLKNLQEKYAFSYLFISHDLKVVRSISHRVMVMRKGKIIEQGPTETIFNSPQHTYTKSLIAAALAFEIK